jgi:hypothetical protein
MKNIHLIPTEKPSRLCIDNSCNELNYSEVEGLNSKHITNQNIYITNDEKVEIGEYGLGYAHGIKNGIGSGWFLFKHDGSNQAKLNALCTDTKKVIITNDSELIKDGVQAVDDGFLVWFIDNPNSKVIKIEKEQVNNKPGSSYSTITYYKYKIIIPQEEPKQEYEYIGECNGNNDNGCFLDSCGHDCGCFERVLKQSKKETLEEAAEHHWKMQYLMALDESIKHYVIQDFIAGAKWQAERMYSEEELLDAFEAGMMFIGEDKGSFREWFEQFKKK